MDYKLTCNAFSWTSIPSTTTSLVLFAKKTIPEIFEATIRIQHGHCHIIKLNFSACNPRQSTAKVRHLNQEYFYTRWTEYGKNFVIYYVAQQMHNILTVMSIL